MAAKASTWGRAHTAAAALVAIAFTTYAIAHPVRAPAAPVVPADLTFDAMDQLDQARVTIGARRSQVPCKPQGSRIQCGTERWNFVGAYAARSMGRAVRCIWVHPSAKRKVHRLLWPDAPLGARLQASLRLLARSARGRPARARIAVDDAIIGRLETSHEATAGRIERELPPGPARGELAVDIDADKNGWLLACLKLRMFGQRGGRRGR